MRSWPLPAGGSTGSMPLTFLRYLRVGGFLATDGLLPGAVGDRLDLDAALLGDAPRRGEVLQPVHRGADHVVRVGGAQALGQDVTHARALEHRAHRTAGDDARARRGGLQEHAPRAVVAHDLVRNGAARERDLHHLAARRLDGLAHRLAHFIRLAGRDAHPALPVADRDQRVEAEAPASLHDLGDAVDRDHVLDQAVALALALALVAPRAPPATAAPPRPPRPPRPPGAPGAPGAPGPTRPTRPTRSGRWCARRLRPARVRGGWLRGA